ncbi:MFS transporter [Brevibacillus ginsengisoli]|uniref:MFS transporter n=1 Tax=Brevibacillus ginsengisoli TaxID=363854 RepID=UPI003CF53781
MQLQANVAEVPVWRNRNFISLWLGTVCSAVGDSSIYILLSWFIVDVTGSEAVLGTALLCMSLPRLVFMLFGGVIADRFNRKLVLGLSLMARAIVIGLFSLFLLAGENEWLAPAIYVMSVAFGIVDSFFWPARSSIVPQVIPKERLSTANSIMETSQQVSNIIGPLFASLLLYSKNYPLMFATIAAVFLLSVIAILSLRITHISDERPNQSAASSIVHDTLEGIRYVKPIRSIVIILFISLFFNVTFMGPLSIGLPMLIKQMSWDGTFFGYLQGAIGVGAIIGALITGLSKGFRGYYNPIIPLFAGLIGMAMVGVSFMSSLPYGLGAMLMIGICLSIINIPIFTYIQTIVEDRMLGRVMSLLTLMSSGLGPVSYAMSAFLLQQHLATPDLLIMGGGICMAMMGFSTILLKDLRQMEQHPAWRQVHAKTNQEAS